MTIKGILQYVVAMVNFKCHTVQQPVFPNTKHYVRQETYFSLTF